MMIHNWRLLLSF